MPKLENFDTNIKVDGNPFAKDAINYQVMAGDGVGLYYSGDRDRRILERLNGSFGQWTNSIDVPYASFAALIADLDLFIFGNSDTETLKDISNQLVNLCRSMDSLLVEQKITNKILSEAYELPLYTEENLNT